MRKRILLAAIAAIMGTAVAMAQQIAVVSENGTTDVYQTLQEAIEGASNGSVIYLPGGGFQIHDSVKITKRLSIIGIGHKAKNENADGNTVISGNLFFNAGSSGSSVMGCYISGNVNVGEDGATNNCTVKLCNINVVNVKNGNCSGTVVEQNYIRSYPCNFANAAVTVKNNIMQGIKSMTGGIVKNNILTAGGYTSYGYVVGSITFNDVHNSTIFNNIILTTGYIEPGDNSNGNTKNSGLVIYENMHRGAWGEEAIDISAEWTEVFTKYNGGSISPVSDFHFKPEYQQYSDCGIYGGDGFSDGALPPVPFIVSKSIPEQTDASGKLNIKIRVKAGE